MSQADKSGWSLSKEDLFKKFDIIADKCGRKVSSDFRLTSHGNGSSTQVRICSTVANIEGLFAIAHPARVGELSSSRTIYHIDNVPRDFFKELSCDADETSKPALCVHNQSSGDLLVLENGEFNYGFVNTTTIGLFSKSLLQDNHENYAHAGCLKINGKGLLILGDQGAGKSTLVSKILSELEREGHYDVDFATDDWVYLQECDQRLVAKRATSEYRLDSDTLANSDISLSETFMRTIRTHQIAEKAAKYSIPVEYICDKFGFSEIESADISRLIILDPRQPKLMQDATFDGIYPILKASTMNVPPLSSDEEEMYRSFWEKQVEQTDIVAMNSRLPEVKIEQIARTILMPHR